MNQTHPRSPAETVRSAAAAWNAGDLDTYLSHFEQDCRRWIVGLDQPLDRHALADAVHQMFGAFEPLTLTAEALFGTDTQVCARWRLQGVHTGEFLGIAASGQTIDVRTCEVYELDRKLVHTVWTYGDPLDIIRQLSAPGAVPA